MLQLSKDFIQFLIKAAGTMNFWLLFLASFVAVLMMAWRASIRDEIFKTIQRGW